MVRELFKAPVCFLFDCCICIARFASLSCYSSVKTRIRPVKLYQINEFFCSITHCVLLCLVYCFIAVSMRFQCLELQVCLSSLPRCFLFESEPEPEPTFELHFELFNHIFLSRFCMQYYCTNPLDLQEYASPI